MLDTNAMKALCRQLLGATEQVQWRDKLVFKVGGKMFVVSGLANDAPYSFKVDDARFLDLTGVPGVRPAPYLARARWVQVDPCECVLAAADIRALLVRSHALVLAKLTKRVQRELQES